MRTLLEQNVRPIGPYRRVMLDDEVAMDFAWVPPGTFFMGSPEDEEGRDAPPDPPCSREGGEGPRHQVVLTRGFWMGTTPVTQGQYASVVDHAPSWHASRDVDAKAIRAILGSDPDWDSTKAYLEVRDCDKPAQEVTWHKAAAFLKRLSKRHGDAGEGPRYRLPTEAEWEYACRAGTTTRFWSGNGEADLARVAWYGENSESDLHPVGKAANPLGLFDMHGNVWEWCADLYDENYYARSPKTNPRCRCKQATSEEWAKSTNRVTRGGYVWGDASSCRSASRNANPAECSHNDIGFRVAADRL